MRVQERHAQTPTLAGLLGDMYGKSRDGLLTAANLLEGLDDPVGIDFQDRLDVEERGSEPRRFACSAAFNQVLERIEQKEQPRSLRDLDRTCLNLLGGQARIARIDGRKHDQGSTLRRTLGGVPDSRALQHRLRGR